MSKVNDAREAAEKEVVVRALNMAGLVVVQAAKDLGVSRQHMYWLMKKHDVKILIDRKLKGGK